MALLIPEQNARILVTNWAEMLPRLENEAAIVDIPYHPAIEDDKHIYGFSVFIAYLDADDMALAEMILLQTYAKELWAHYRHLAQPFKEPGEDLD